MTQKCNITHTPYYKIKYNKETAKLPFDEYLVCKSCYDSGKPWNNPQAIIFIRTVNSDKFKLE